MTDLIELTKSDEPAELRSPSDVAFLVEELAPDETAAGICTTHLCCATSSDMDFDDFVLETVPSA